MRKCTNTGRGFLCSGRQRWLHFLITILLGPLIGALAFFVMFFPGFMRAISAADTSAGEFLAKIPALAYFTFGMGLLPAVLSASLSFAASLRMRSASQHLILSPVFGAFSTATFALVFVVSTGGEWRLMGLMQVGAIGAAAAFGSTLLHLSLTGMRRWLRADQRAQ